MTARLNTCRDVLANISGYLAGELNVTECDEIERHCRACLNCAALVQGLRQTVGLCHQMGTTPLPEDVRRRARERVRELLERESRKR